MGNSWSKNLFRHGVSVGLYSEMQQGLQDNLDYNSLKHEIRAHTAHDQPSAIVIPGHQDAALKKFEDGLHGELCCQYDRVDLFITSKADEISRRLEYLASKTLSCVAESSSARASTLSLKRRRRFANYQNEILRCGEEILALSRFTNAQVVGFRKILKKYKKWTGSTTLTSRFNENKLNNPKGFAKRSFEHLQSRHDEILATLQAAIAQFSEPTSPETDDQEATELPKQHSRRQYWDEYDDGSEGGDPESDYAIYINPDDDTGFPGSAFVNTMLSLPYEKAKQWFKMRRPSQANRPLLISAPGSQVSVGYASTAVNADSDEDRYASFDTYPQLYYATDYTLPSISEQEAQRYREMVFMRGTLVLFLVSFALLGIGGVLILTGKHNLRFEIDAGVTLGVMVSLFCAGSGLAMTLYRRDPVSILYRLMVSSALVASCILNVMLLVLVLGNLP